jgi:hypothetical protein
MRDSESLSLTEFTDYLGSLPVVSTRIMLTEAEPEGGAWVMRAAVMNVSPDIPEACWTLYNYGPFAFVAASPSGAEVAKWYVERQGESAGLRFEVPEIQEQVGAERFPSHARYRYFDRLWQPHTHYELRPKSIHYEPPRERNPLIHDGCPSFPSLSGAVYNLLFDIELARASDRSFPSPPFMLLVAHTEAWIERVEQYASSLVVNVQGDAVKGVRLEVSGSKGVRFDQKLPGPGDVRLELPEGLPPRLWVLLSRGSRWLDLRDLDQYGSRSPWDNIIDVPPDLATQVAGAIARGEGERTEFKEQIPFGKDDFVNVVAAFANGEGGMIIVGVVNKTGEIRGLTCDLGQLRDRLSQVIRSNVYPEPKIKIEVCELNGRKLLVILVEEGKSKPYGVGPDPSKLSFYVRRTATTPPARQEEIRAMISRADDGNAQSPGSRLYRPPY